MDRLSKVGQGVLELLIGNEKVTDGWTDRHTYIHTCSKQYALSSFEVGHNKLRALWKIDINKCIFSIPKQ